ncbi:hypothetical protein EHW67_00430 [Arenibacter aquaticus]|uniref:Uncharacterized protein n=1 Tax=Arenibacter aquaticus TaxID=2489054 RepID=A0A3S0AGC1_9FLAO|nr:hypothetical protein [Arenibacter aquaticus]RTE55070.1 hypothetical protein EHW67_00430 [Arenibacter aquaticus]
MLYPRITHLISLGVLLFLCFCCREPLDKQPQNTTPESTPSLESQDKNKSLAPQKNVPDSNNSRNKNKYRNKSRTMDSLRVKIAVL